MNEVDLEKRFICILLRRLPELVRPQVNSEEPALPWPPQKNARLPGPQPISSTRKGSEPGLRLPKIVSRRKGKCANFRRSPKVSLALIAINIEIFFFMQKSRTEVGAILR